MTRPPAPDDPDDTDDAALFRAAIGPVRELPAPPAPPSKPKPRPNTRMRDLDEAHAPSEFQRALDEAPLLAGDALSHRRDEVPPRVLRRLARGEYAAQDEIDLHLAVSTQAEAILRRFLREAVDAGFTCVRVIHGKGLHAPDGVPTLKNLV